MPGSPRWARRHAIASTVWRSLSDDDRIRTTQELFALATLYDDRGILVDACVRVPELRDEFADLLDPPVNPPGNQPAASTPPAPVPGTNRKDLGREDDKQVSEATGTAQDDWHAAFRSLAAIATAAIESPADPAVLVKVHRIIQEFERLAPRLQQEQEAAAATDALKSLAQSFLAQIGAHASCEAIAPNDLALYRGGWQGLPELAPGDARAEQDRLEGVVPGLLDNLKQTDSRHKTVEEQLDELRSRRPSDRQALRDWEDAQDDLRRRARQFLRERRRAEDALLEALAPPVRLGEPEADAEAPDSTTAPGDDSPEVSEATGPVDSAVPESVPTEPPRDGISDSSDGAETAAATATETPPPTAEPIAAGDEAKPLEAESMDQHDPSLEAVAATRPSDPEPEGEAEESTATALASDRSRHAHEALAQALNEDPPRLAYAAQVCRVLDQLGIDAGQPRTALLEAALFASRLRNSDGELAAEFKSAVERALEASPTSNQDAGSINAEALIAFSAALPATLLAPYSGATALLEELTHEGLDPLYQFAKDMAKGSWEVQKAQIDAETLLRTARDQATQEDALDELLRDLDAWNQGPARRPLSYTPANKVWRALAQSGELGELLGTIRTQGNRDRARVLLGELEDRGKLRKIVDRLSSEVLSNRQSIDTKIFRQFQRHLEKPLELARRYLSLEASPSFGADHRKQVVDELVHTLRNDGPKLRSVLERRAVDSQEDGFSKAAAALAARSLRLVESLIDPQAPYCRGEEPSPAQLLASGLFPFPEVRIDDYGTTEGDPEDTLQALLESEPLPLTDALPRNLENAEIRTAERILDWLEAETALGDDFESWRRRIRNTRRELLESLREQLDEVRERLDLAFLQGQLDPDQNADHQARLHLVEEALEGDSGGQLNRQREEIQRVQRELKAAVASSQCEVLDGARAKFPDSTDPQRRRIEQHVEDGDLVTAYELLCRPSDDLPARRDEQDGQPTLFDNYIKVGRERLRELGADWKELRDSVRRGHRVGPLRFDHLDHSERASAVALLDAWTALKRCRTAVRGEIATAARELFAAIGFLDTTVEVEQTGAGFAAATVNVAPLRSRNDCPVPHFGSEADGSYRALLFFNSATAEQVLQRLQQPALQRASIALYLEPMGEHTHRRLSRMNREQSQALVTLDESLLVFLAAQTGSRLAGFFACALPYTHNQPFVRRAGVVPPEVFFGRDAEAREVADFRGSCFLYGGRQLGKTALLRNVERDYSDPALGRFAAWIDLKAEGIGDEHTADVWVAVWRGLRRIGAIDETTKKPTRSRTSVEAFMEALHEQFNQESGRTLLLLFDEADSFLRRDAMNSSRETFAESTRLKSLMDRDHSIKVVFAGLHNVLRTTTQSNHPLAHLGRPIQIGPFIKREERHYAEQLLRLPLEACGYRFEAPKLVIRVLAQANYYPSLLQIYGATLVNRLSGPPGRTDSPVRKIGRGLLDVLQRDRVLREEIRRRFEWTLQLDPRYEAIAYAMASECLEDKTLLSGGIGDDRILSHVRVWWPNGFRELGRDLEQFKALLDEMVELGVLRQTDPDNHGGRYSLRNPNVIALLGDRKDVENRLDSFENRAASPEPGPFEIRRRHGDKSPLHRPLTLWQERRITGQVDPPHRLVRRRNAVVLVCGLEASGIRHVGSFLQWGKERGEAVALQPTKTLGDFKRALKRHLDSRDHETTAIIVPDDNWQESWIDAARARLGNLRSEQKFVRVIFTLDEDRLIAQRSALDRWLDRGGVDLVGLRPWSKDFAALALDDDADVGEKLRGEQEQQLADRAGGWPVLLDLILERLRTGLNASELIKAEGFATLLAEDAERLRSAFGLDRDDLLAALSLVDVYGSATLDNLLDPEARKLIKCELSDDELRNAIWAAEKLHLVKSGGEGKWQLDSLVGQILGLVTS